MRRRALLALCLAFTLPSCAVLLPAPMRAHSWLADARDLDVVRRVLVLPLVGPAVPLDYLKSFGAELRNTLSGAARFQVLDLDTRDPDQVKLWETEKSGHLSLDALVDLGRKFAVDGVLLARITHFRAYLPPSIGVHLQLVSVHSGEAIWVVDQVFDSRRERIRLDTMRYAHDELAPETSLHDAEMVQLSPRRFGAYCCKRIVETLRATPSSP